jgi:CMP-N,N'-diacetyllegionaminic acid synthase
MIENLKVLAIIPARGGSKGLPGKNISPLNGLPLIAYSIEAARQSKFVDHCIVTSDCPTILEVARNYGSDIIRRPDELANDTASSESAVSHAISKFADYDLILLLQPTSPLRTYRDIDLSIEALVQSNATALISVFEPKHTPFKCFKLAEGGYLTGLVDNNSPFMRRQDLPMALMPNGAIYLIYKDEFLLNESFFTEMTIPYIMSETQSIDIDTSDDLALAACLLQQQTDT